MLKNLNYLPWLVCMKHSRPFFLNQQTTPFTTVALILLHVEDEHKIWGLWWGSSYFSCRMPAKYDGVGEGEFKLTKP